MIFNGVAIFSLCFIKIIMADMYSCLNGSNEVVYNMFGAVSFSETIQNCVNNVKDPLLFPGYSTGKVLNVSTQVLVNNLIVIDELQNSVGLDLFVLFIWKDPRFNMPEMWAETDAKNVDLSMMAQEDDKPLIWMPDIIFPDVVTQTQTNFYLKIYPGGEFRWMRHYTFQFLQSNLNYRAYPDDTLDIKINFFSFTMTTAQLHITDFTGIPFEQYTTQPSLIFSLNENGEKLFSFNPIWSLEDSSIKFHSTRLSAYNSPRSTCSVSLSVRRRSDGAVYRLVFPIFLLLIVGAVQFWAKAEDRISTTLTLLLAVSALYIVIFQNIPMVGYLTKLDMFGLGVYSALFLCCLTHQYLLSFDLQSEKNNQWPLRKVEASIIETIWKLFLVPLSTAVFIILFGRGFGWTLCSLMIAAVVVFMTVVLTKQLPYMAKVLRVGRKALRHKLGAHGFVTDHMLTTVHRKFLKLHHLHLLLSRIYNMCCCGDSNKQEQKCEGNSAQHKPRKETMMVSMLEIFAFNWFEFGRITSSTKLLTRVRSVMHKNVELTVEHAILIVREQQSGQLGGEHHFRSPHCVINRLEEGRGGEDGLESGDSEMDNEYVDNYMSNETVDIGGGGIVIDYNQHGDNLMGAMLQSKSYSRRGYDSVAGTACTTPTNSRSPTPKVLQHKRLVPNTPPPQQQQQQQPQGEREVSLVPLYFHTREASQKSTLSAVSDSTVVHDSSQENM